MALESPYYIKFMADMASPLRTQADTQVRTTSGLLPTSPAGDFSQFANKNMQGSFDTLNQIATTIAQNRANSDEQYAAQRAKSQMESLLAQLRAAQSAANNAGSGGYAPNYGGINGNPGGNLGGNYGGGGGNPGYSFPSLTPNPVVAPPPNQYVPPTSIRDPGWNPAPVGMTGVPPWGR